MSNLLDNNYMARNPELIVMIYKAMLSLDCIVFTPVTFRKDFLIHLKISLPSPSHLKLSTLSSTFLLKSNE